MFVASLQSTSFVVSPAEGERAPGSSGPVHLGRTKRPNVNASAEEGPITEVPASLCVTRPESGEAHADMPRAPRPDTSTLPPARLKLQV